MSAVQAANRVSPVPLVGSIGCNTAPPDFIFCAAEGRGVPPAIRAIVVPDNDILTVSQWGLAVLALLLAAAGTVVFA